MRSGAEAFPQVVTLLDSVSPYGSRRLTVEFDGATTAAYLHDETTVVAATWIANHVRAPRTTDLARLNAGQAPLMPAACTRHPRGRPPLDPATLQVLWFEEGDGVALLERGTLLAVIPGWSDMSRGRPGYSRDVIGQTPFSWSLDDAIDGLGPRVERAHEFWQWRNSPAGWGHFQQAALGHLTERLGPVAQNGQPIPHPACDDTHMVTRSGYFISTDSTSAPSCRRHSILRVAPLSHASSRSDVSSVGNSSLARADRTAAGRSVMSSGESVYLPK